MENLNRALLRLKDCANEIQLDLKEAMLTYDRRRTGAISNYFFNRVITKNNLQLTPAQVSTIEAAFQQNGQFDYPKFFEALDTLEPEEDSGPRCVEELNMLNKHLQSKQATLRELLAPADRFNRGKLTEDQIYRAIDYTRWMQKICHEYKDPYNGMVDYFKIQQHLPLAAKMEPKRRELEMPDFFEDYARALKLRSIDLRLPFSQFDKWNLGKVYPEHFASVVGTLGIQLSPHQIHQLTDAFMVDGGLCSYKQFAEKVAAVEMPEKERTAPETPRVDLDTVLATLKERAATRKVDLEQVLRDADYQRKGVLPPTKFGSLLAGLQFSLTRAEIQELLDSYDNGNGDFDYEAMLKALYPPQAHAIQESQHDVLNRLKEFLADKRIQLRRFIMKYDRDMTGEITTQQLISTIQYVMYPLTEKEEKVICKAFPGSARNLVSWIDLCDVVDPVLPDPSPVKAPPVEHSPVKARRPEPPMNVHQVLLKIKTRAETLGDELRRMDRMKRGCLNQTQFSGFMLSYFPMLEQIDIIVLANYYKSNSGHEIDYGWLIEDLDGVEVPDEDEDEPTLGPNIISVLKRLKLYVEQRRIPIDDVFPVDTYVPTNRVHGLLTSIGFQCTRDEVAHLITAFRDARRSEAFNTNAFVRAIRHTDINSSEARASMNSGTISAEIDSIAQIATSQLKEKLSARHRSICLAFRGVTSDLVSADEFQRRLSSMDLVLRANQITALIRKYKRNLNNEIDWQAFCSDVENARTVG